MLTAVIIFIISWLAFILFADKKKLSLYIPTVYMGIILALITDLMILIYPLWNYPGTATESFFINLLNISGMYFVVIYLFLQTLSKKDTFFAVVSRIFYWTVFAFILETISLYIGFFEHKLWWNIIYSYLADWILFVLFYFHHKWPSGEGVNKQL